jgi:tetratricopeptide (TPR) repeat protein
VIREPTTIAVTRITSGAFDLAIADYSSAIAIDPGFVYAYFDRGKAQEAKRAYDLAIKDYAEAINRGPKTTRAVLRLYIVSSHVSAAATSAGRELEANAKGLIRSDPLYPLVELFLGRLTADAVLASAGDNRCEIQFYVANWHELQGDNQRAVQALNEALGLCSKADIPYYDAKIELNGLSK